MSCLSFWVDESEKEDFLVVGGILVPWIRVSKIIYELQNIKLKFSLDPSDEIKWNIPRNSMTRKKLENQGTKTRTLLEKLIDYIKVQKDITVIAACMFEKRDREQWKRVIHKNASVRDFYCEGLHYVLQRVAEECKETGSASCVIICDTPPSKGPRFRLGSIVVGPKAIEKKYIEWYFEGVGYGPGKIYQGNLLDLRFHPSILIGDATYHDMLQISDVVVGAIREWIYNVNKNKRDYWLISQIKKLSVRFRHKYGKPDFWGDGLIIWPWQNDLWKKLKNSLR